MVVALAVWIALAMLGRIEYDAHKDDAVGQACYEKAAACAVQAEP